mgnify:CR=1 FL=1
MGKGKGPDCLACVCPALSPTAEARAAVGHAQPWGPAPSLPALSRPPFWVMTACWSAAAANVGQVGEWDEAGLGSWDTAKRLAARWHTVTCPTRQTRIPTLDHSFPSPTRPSPLGPLIRTSLLAELPTDTAGLLCAVALPEAFVRVKAARTDSVPLARALPLSRPHARDGHILREHRDRSILRERL